MPTNSTEIASFLSSFKEVSKKILEWRNLIPIFSERNTLISIQGISALEKAINLMATQFKNKENEINKSRLNLSNIVQFEIETFQKFITKIYEKWNSINPVDENMNPEKSIEIIKDFLSKIQRSRNLWQQLEQARKSFQMSMFNSFELSSIDEE
jgi:hypothetical protein